MNTQTLENDFHAAVAKGTLALQELYHLGEAIKNDTTYAQVDTDANLAAWEKDLIKVLIFLRPLFNYILSKFAALKSIIDWAENIYQTFAAQGKVPA